MKYQEAYDRLINRAKFRILNKKEYYESHHVVPRCLGGTDEADNLVNLTAREHYVAHQLLVKIHTDNYGLVKAAVMMACESTHQMRSKNRIYEWLRKRHSVAMSVSQTGDGNSQFGSTWIYNVNLKENKKIKLTDLPMFEIQGWEKGRVTDFNSIYQTCIMCGKEFRLYFKKMTCSQSCHESHISKHKSFTGREEEFRENYRKTKSINKSLKMMGYPGAISHYYHWARTLLPVDLNQ